MYALEDSYWWFVGRRAIISAIIERTVAAPPRMILDLGCGTGATLPTLRRYGPVVGMDMSATALAFSRRRGETRLVLAAAEAVAVADESVDVVTMLDILEHLDDDLAALREIRRVLRPGGRLIITVPAYRWLWSEHDEALHHRRRYLATELRRTVEAAGYSTRLLTYAISVALIPTVFFRLLRRMRRRRGEPTTALLPLPHNLNQILIALLQLEARLIRHGSRLPFGVSVVMCAEKVMPCSGTMTTKSP